MTTPVALDGCGTPAEHDPAAPRAPLGPTIALAVCLAIGALLVLGPVIWWLLPVTELPAPFLDHHQDAENLIFLVAFAVATPLGVVASARISDRIARGPDGGELAVLAALLSIGLAAVVVVTRASAELPWGGGPRTLAAAAGLWWALAAVTLGSAASPRRSGGRAAVTQRASWIWGLAALLVAPVALSFTDLGSISWTALLGGAAIAAAVMVLRERSQVPTTPRGLGAALDVAVVVLLVLAVPNVAIFAYGDPAAGLDTAIIQFHQNFYLGPVNQILSGDAMLVDVLSQYGVGSIYFLAGLFTVLPIGNGMLGLIEGLLSAVVFVATYATLRIAGVSRLLASAAMALAVVALVYGLQNPIGGLLQHGAIRFGLPAGVILGAVVESRWPRAATPARGLQLLTVAVASIWALEAFAYTLLTVLAVAVLWAAIRPAGERRGALLRWGAQIAGACVLAHLLLAVGTLAAVGELPNWGWYLNTLREFLVGKVGDWTYDFSSFSPGLAVGGLYVASAAALSLVVLRRPDLVRQHRTTLFAIAGTTAHGIALFSYLVNRSADHIIPYVCLPAVALGALWLDLLSRSRPGLGPAGRRAAVGIGLAVSALLVAVAWPSIGARYEQSALAHVVPGGPSLASAVDQLRDPPALRPEAVEGVELLNAYMPGEERSIVLTDADLSVEILMRAGRGSRVPLGDPWEDSFVPDQHLGRLGDLVDSLAAGDRALLDARGRAAFDLYRSRPSLDPFTADEGEALAIVPSGLASLQKWVLEEIGQRFDLHTLALTESGMEVVELAPPGT